MKKILDGLEGLIRTLCTFLFLCIAVLIAVQVFTRYVLDMTLSWSEQAARGVFIWLIMLYSGVLVRNGGNLGFDILTQRLKGKGKAACLLFSDLIILAFSGYWFYQSLQLCLSFQNFRFSGLKLPYNAIYAAEPVGAALIALFTVEVLLRHIREAGGTPAAGIEAMSGSAGADDGTAAAGPAGTDDGTADPELQERGDMQ